MALRNLGDVTLDYQLVVWVRNETLMEPYRTRSAYRYALEDSVYIANDAVGHGVGRQLLDHILQRSTALGYRQMIAIIGDSGHKASIGLHEQAGFQRIGIFPSVGFKFNRWVDSVLMQRSLGPGDAAAPVEMRRP